MATISACIISKNEHKNINRCLASIKDFCEEIILVDTGSTDNTVYIAKEFKNCQIYTVPWNNNFSASKNIALKKATMDWILLIDCDEFLDSPNAITLKSTLDNCPYVALCLPIINIIKDSYIQGPNLLRLIRNNKSFYFEGKIHEQILPSIYKTYSSNDIANTNLIIYHTGYDLTPEELNLKSKRNFDILNSYKESEKDGFYYYNLGNQHLNSNNLELAIICYERALTFEDNYLGFKLYIPPNLLQCYYLLGKFSEVVKRGAELLYLYPEYRDIYFIIGISYKALNRNDLAKDFLEKYLSISPSNNIYPDKSFDKLNNIPSIISNLI